MADPLEDSPTPIRSESFAAARVEFCLADIIRAVHRFVSPLPESVEDEIRDCLQSLVALNKRTSETAQRAASQAEIEADNERKLRTQAEVRCSELEHELAVTQIRLKHLAGELDELRREIQK